MIGLNFTHFDSGPFKHLTLDPAAMKNWGPAMWALFAFVALLLASILYTCGTQYSKMGLISGYMLWATIFLGYMKWNTIRQRANGKAIHIHHYFLAMVMMSFIQLQTPLISITHAFFHGMFIEGSCRWGFDPCWIYVGTDEASDGDTESQEETVVQDIDDAKTSIERRDATLLQAKQAEVRRENYILAAPQHSPIDYYNGEQTFVSGNVVEQEYPASGYGSSVMQPITTEKQLPSELLNLLTPIKQQS